MANVRAVGVLMQLGLETLQRPVRCHEPVLTSRWLSNDAFTVVLQTLRISRRKILQSWTSVTASSGIFSRRSVIAPVPSGMQNE